MGSQPYDRITLELEPGEPIRGRLLDHGGMAHVFHGWLELSAALDRARRHAIPEDGNEDQDTAPSAATVEQE